MLDIITGKTRPDQGRVVWDEDTDLTRLDEASCARLGIGRKFQKPTVFETLTVEANVMLALAGKRGVAATLFHKLSGRERSASTSSSSSSASPARASGSPAASATARSSGSRSACCSRRTRSSSSSTSPPPA